MAASPRTGVTTMTRSWAQVDAHAHTRCANVAQERPSQSLREGALVPTVGRRDLCEGVARGSPRASMLESYHGRSEFIVTGDDVDVTLGQRGLPSAQASCHPAAAKSPLISRAQ